MSDILQILEEQRQKTKPDSNSYGEPEIAIVPEPPSIADEITDEALEESVKRARGISRGAPKGKRSDKTLHPDYGKLNQDVYSAPDLAVRLGVHKVTILTEINEGRLRAKQIGGAAGYRISHGAVLEWLSTPDD